jgi:hypothetical protein
MAAIVLAAILALVVARTRCARWSVYAAPVLVWFFTEAGNFDGERHVNQKFDATFLVWVQAVELRSLAGLALLVLAAPIGAVGSVGRGSLLGLAALGPFGAALLASSALVLRGVPPIFSGAFSVTHPAAGS